MPLLYGTGPEGKGSKTGRSLGSCLNPGEKKTVGKLGIGMGQRRKSGGGEGQGKRLKSGLNMNETDQRTFK